jgi:hypothetical protein
VILCCVSGALAAAQARFDRVEAGQDVCDGLHDVVRALAPQEPVGLRDPAALFVGWQRGEVRG